MSLVMRTMMLLVTAD
ncbi:hypothetical protein LINPERPRIM_LOCUS331 [Linum perenne]